ncbi:MAG: hypothetical protein JWM34_3975 [Ilumatobacteraceae bacterium]|nr:hypothetical protein [Ilumatobacteraceae bacterium]
MNIKPGMRLFGVGQTEGIVVRCGPGDADVRIGGHRPATSAAGRDDDAAVVVGHDEPTLVGKRYVDADGTIELLCTRAGSGAFALGDVVLQPKDATPLPSSD